MVIFKKDTFGLLVSFYIYVFSFLMFFIFFWPCLVGIIRKRGFIRHEGESYRFYQIINSCMNCIE